MMPVLSPISRDDKALKAWLANNVLVPGVRLSRTAESGAAIDVTVELLDSRLGPQRTAWPVHWYLSESREATNLVNGPALTVTAPSDGRIVKQTTAGKEGYAMPDRTTGTLVIRVAR